MPFPTEHSCRLEDPGKYDRFDRKNCDRRHEGKCIDVIYGITDGASEAQALRYKTKTWNESDARAHCNEQEGQFEPAKEEDRNMKRKWYSFDFKNDVAEIEIFDEIGAFGIWVDEFKRDFDRIKGSSKIRVLLNSPGGIITEGMALYHILSSVREKLTVEVIGIAASIASVIALAGKELVMGEGTYFMIHNPWAGTWGEASELRKTADILDKMKGELVRLYANRTGMEEEEIVRLMDEETWYTATEAMEAGFADRVEDYGDLAAKMFDLDLFGFSKVPGELRKHVFAHRADQIKTERDFEQFLRDAGFSRSRSVAITRTGFKVSPRDARHADDQRDAEELQLCAAAVSRNIQTLKEQES